MQQKQYEEMYSKLPNLTIGFHGCNRNTFENVLYRHQNLRKSNNSYDWLGSGSYFWENSFCRAYQWANNKYGKDAAVIGAIIDLGFCLNLTDYKAVNILKQGYEMLKMKCRVMETVMPINRNGKYSSGLLLRNLDCAVIQQIQENNRTKGKPEYDSVRGVFTEGEEIYPNAGFLGKTHIQLCIVNPNCIKGYFSPRAYDEEYPIP